jgi:hypothetical protein
LGFKKEKGKSGKTLKKQRNFNIEALISVAKAKYIRPTGGGEGSG